MNQQQWILFLKYPYCAAVIGCIWIGSAAMVIINNELPIIAILIINLITSWLIAGFGFRPDTFK